MAKGGLKIRVQKISKVIIKNTQNKPVPNKFYLRIMKGRLFFFGLLKGSPKTSVRLWACFGEISKYLFQKSLLLAKVEILFIIKAKHSKGKYFKNCLFFLKNEWYESWNIDWFRLVVSVLPKTLKDFFRKTFSA